MEPETITVDEQTLKELGIENLSEDAQREAIAAFYDTLKNRFGAALNERLTAEELDEFAAVLERNDEKEITDWMDKHVPDQQEIFDTELAALKEDIRTQREELRQGLNESQQ